MTQPHQIPGSPPASAAPPADTTHDERTHAMLAHVLSIFTGFLGPAVIYFAKRKESRFVAFHAQQALIWHLGLFVMMFAGMAVFVVSMFAGGMASRSPSSPAHEPPWWFLGGFFALWGLIMLSWFVSMGYAVYMAMQASSGRWARYPLVGRFVRPPLIGART